MNLKEKLKLIPKQPGCYQYYDINGEIIYVGKAKNLYNRVNSYFVGKQNNKTAKLVSQIVDVQYIITSSEVEDISMLLADQNPNVRFSTTFSQVFKSPILTLI